MDSFDKTMKFNVQDESMEEEVKHVMVHVHDALEEKGYNAVNQIVGYLLSGDPAYIPRHQDARNVIRKLERDEILEELVKFYIRHTQEGKDA
ncbi:IreB family regulatory phosphoprotein [Chryseomicrobium sp. FSL W7-1435]|uniref:IreB family regulatory phosphoprotein n=1 Tax=Chryseomicrobium sp. FSL W7-1435 TaxID=2921704 RepID=UPI003159FE31